MSLAPHSFRPRMPSLSIKCQNELGTGKAIMGLTKTLDLRLVSILECPRDHSELRVENGNFCCLLGHKYPILDGIPIFLLAEKEQTIGIASASLEAAEKAMGGHLYIDTI